MQQIISLQLSGYSHRTADRPHRNKIKTSSVAPCLLAGEWGSPSPLQQDLGQWWDWDGVQQPAAIRGAWRLAGMSATQPATLTLTAAAYTWQCFGLPWGGPRGLSCFVVNWPDFNTCRKQPSLLGHKAQEIHSTTFRLSSKQSPSWNLNLTLAPQLKLECYDESLQAVSNLGKTLMPITPQDDGKD